MYKIFTTEERIKILNGIVFKENELSVNRNAFMLSLSKGFVSKYFDILVREGILEKKGVKYALVNSPLLKGIRILLNAHKINPRIFKKFKFIKSAGIYGSCARGENTESSDVDIWIRHSDVKESDLALCVSDITKKLRGAKILFLSDKKLEKLAKEETLCSITL